MLSMSLVNAQVVGNEDVTVENGKVKADITVTNTGSESIDQMLVELQPRAGSCSDTLAIISDNELTCDSHYPQNVHKKIRNFEPSEKVTFSLETPKLPNGDYCAVLVSTDKCCPKYECEAVSPYGWGKNIKTVTVTGGDDDQRCGDGPCMGNENYKNCPQDCISWCGDGVCDKTKDEQEFCPQDCTGSDLMSWLENNMLLLGAVIFLVFASAYVYYQKR